MVGVTAILSGYLLNQFFPDTFSGSYNSPLFMFLFCIVFALGVAYIAYRGVTGTTGVNTAINVIQITALLVFTVIAISYRVKHKQDSVGWHLSNGTAVTYQVDTMPVLDDKGKPVQDSFADASPKVDDKGQPVYKTADRAVTKDDLANKDVPLPADLAVGDPYPVLQKDADGKLVLKDGQAVPVPFTVSYKPEDAMTGTAGDAKNPLTFNFHQTAGLGRRAALVQLHLHPGVHRHPDPRRLRVRHGDGRGSQERQARRAPRGAALAARSRAASATSWNISRRITSCTTATRCRWRRPPARRLATRW